MDITELNREADIKKINRHPWELARARVVHYLLKKYKPVSKHLTDIGSGDAFLLKHLADQQHASMYTSIDIAYTPDLLKRLRDSGDERISYYNDSASLPATKEKADLVLFLDVLEHCADDLGVLRSAVDMSATDASFLVTVPAFQSLYSSHDTLLLHYRRYNRRQLVALCRTAGLQIEKSGYFFSVLLPFRLWQVMLERLHLRKATSSIDNWKGNKLLTMVFYTILRVDFRLSYALSIIGLQIPGLSSYCICRKSPL